MAGESPDHENPWGLFSVGWVASWIVGTLAVANDPHLNLGRFSLRDYLLFLAIFDGPVLAIEEIDRRRRRARYNRRLWFAPRAFAPASPEALDTGGRPRLARSGDGPAGRSSLCPRLTQTRACLGYLLGSHVGAGFRWRPPFGLPGIAPARSGASADPPPTMTGVAAPHARDRRWSRLRDSNPGPELYESPALPLS